MGIHSCSFYWKSAGIGEATRWVLFHIKPCFKLIYFTTPSPLSHEYLVSYHRYFKSELNEYIIKNFEWGLNMEHCAASVKTMFSKSITQILPFCDNSYTHQCRFSMPTKQFYFHWKQVETGDDILQILKMVENPSNSPHLEKISSRTLHTAVMGLFWGGVKMSGTLFEF